MYQEKYITNTLEQCIFKFVRTDENLKPFFQEHALIFWKYNSIYMYAQSKLFFCKHKWNLWLNANTE